MTRVSNELVSAALAAAIDTGGILEDATLGLFTNEWDFGTEPLTADLTAPTFTGYAAAACTLTEHIDVNGNRYLSTEPVEFSPTNATNLPQQIRGWYLRKATTNEFLVGGNFETPITVAVADQVFHVVGIVPWEALQRLSSGHAAIM